MNKRGHHTKKTNSVLFAKQKNWDTHLLTERSVTVVCHFTPKDDTYFLFNCYYISESLLKQEEDLVKIFFIPSSEFCTRQSYKGKKPSVCDSYPWLLQSLDEPEPANVSRIKTKPDRQTQEFCHFACHPFACKPNLRQSRKPQEDGRVGV